MELGSTPRWLDNPGKNLPQRLSYRERTGRDRSPMLSGMAARGRRRGTGCGRGDAIHLEPTTPNDRDRETGRVREASYHDSQGTQ